MNEPQRSLAAAKSVIGACEAKGFCCTRDEQGDESCRVMDINFLDSDDKMTFALITRPHTRKAREISSSSTGVNSVSLLFHDPRAKGENGYVALRGKVRQLKDPVEKSKCWKSSWSFFHQPQGGSCIYEFEPSRVEVINHSAGVNPSWKPSTLMRTYSTSARNIPWKKVETPSIYS